MPSARILEIANATKRDLYNQFTYGFELETQSSGVSSYLFSHSKAEQTRQNRAEKFEEFKHLLVDAEALIKEYLNTPAGLSLLAGIEFDPQDLAAMPPKVRACINLLSRLAIPARRLPDLLNLEDLKVLNLDLSFKDFLDKAQLDILANEIKRKAPSDLTYPHKNIKDFLKHMFKMSNLVSAGRDGSVDGFEFRTVGGLEIKDFLKAAEEVFKLNHVIDEQCSFHIHLQAKDIEHQYGQTIQRALMSYILEHQHLVPAAVKARWNWRDQEQLQKYFRPMISSEKYTFVNFNCLHSTWEFRGFGNIKTLAEARACVHLVSKAMRHAYRIKCKLEPAITERWSQAWGCQAIAQNVPVSQVIRA